MTMNSGIYCIWNTINNKIYVGSSENYLAEEQRLLDYIFANNIPKYNVAVKAGGGLLGGTKEQHIKLCLQDLSKAELRKRSEVGNSPVAKPFIIKAEDGAIVLRAESTYW